MTLAPGGRLGPYEIETSLGAGGMGEVYRARDTRLDRIVAIKILSQHLSASSDARQRFEREARAISQISHPHICALYDVGVEDGIHYLVMEHLEGETLMHRLAGGALPLPQTVRIGTQIAEALSVAHRRGIVHRDLKPSNVMLTASGVKLLDFGLAKAAAGPAAHASEGALTTATSVTQAGTILGTLPYMSPEQLEGKDADARTDIFALGAVLHEMATGKQPFNGTSQASLIAAILKEDPAPISTYQPLSPRSLDRVVGICLAKDPEDRWQSARDVAHELRSVAESLGSDAPRSVRAGRTRERIAWGAFAVAAVVVLVCVTLLLRSKPEPVEVFTSSILPPEKQRFEFANAPPVVSPDGRRIAFVAHPAEGPGLLWVRSFDGSSANPLPGTEGALAVFWSPDSRSLGFFAAGKLKRIDLSRSAPQTLCEAPNPGGAGSWSPEGVIIFVPSRGGPVHRVAASGGAASPVTAIDRTKEFGHYWPVFLPDGRHFLYYVGSTIDRKQSGVFIGQLDSTDHSFVVSTRANFAFAPLATASSRGHLLFLKDRVLMAQVFDLARLRLTGEATPVAEQVQYLGAAGTGVFSASHNGVLAYQASSGGELSRLVWVDREGKHLDVIASGGAYGHPRLSNDGRRVAYAIIDPQTANVDIWMHDLTRRTSSPLTFGPGVNLSPVWSPDDRWIFFSSNRNGMHELYRKDTSGNGQDELLLPSGGGIWAVDYSAKNGLIALQSRDTAGEPSGSDIQVLSPTDRKVTTLLATPFSETTPQFSPDGRWLAYASNESSRSEVYVRAVSASGAKWPVSISGGIRPRWSRDGREIFFIAPEDTLMAVDVATGSEFRVAVPRPLFRVDFKIVDIGYPYDVSPDGKRFLINEVVEEGQPATITVVQNWTSKLK
jgi:serine/threonine protein kinase/dipeptidyl aminopeptidase/acylaminoacyl peptidase